MSRKKEIQIERERERDAVAILAQAILPLPLGALCDGPLCGWGSSLSRQRLDVHYRRGGLGSIPLPISDEARWPKPFHGEYGDKKLFGNIFLSDP